MKNKINISVILRFAALLLFVFMLNACGNDRTMRKMIQDPTTNANASWEMMDDPKCWQGEIVNEIYSLTGTISMNMYSKLCEGAMALMMIAFGLWLAFKIAKHVASFTEESPAEFWTEVTQKLFICIVCGLLASSTTNVLFVLNYIIFPIYNALLELGSAMISNINRNTINIFGTTWNVPFQTTSMQHTLLCQSGPLANATLENGFPVEPLKMMECLTCAVSERLNFGMRLGLMTMIKMPLTGIVAGGILIIVFIIVKLAFVFYLIDAIFRFALMVMILPLLIMSYAFKTTRNWVKIGFFTILNSAGILMMISIIIVMVLLGIHQLLRAYSTWILLGLVTGLAAISASSAAGGGGDGGDTGDTALATSDQAGGLDDLGVPFLVLLMMAFLVIGVIKIAKHMADTLIGGGGDANFQKKVAARVMQLAKLALFSFGGKALTAIGGNKNNFISKLGNHLSSASNRGSSDDNSDDA